MQNVALIKARRVAPKEGRMWTTKAEESDFGGAIVGNAKHTRSYLICMHIVTALALALSSQSAMHRRRRKCMCTAVRERAREREEGWVGGGIEGRVVWVRPRGAKRVFTEGSLITRRRLCPHTSTSVSGAGVRARMYARVHARKGRAHARAETRARAGRTLQILVHYQKCQ